MMLQVAAGQRISVKDIGAVGDGIADDTAALNEAVRVACSSGQELYLPAGTYRTQPLNTANGCDMTVYGDGPSDSVITLADPVSPGSAGGQSQPIPGILVFSGYGHNVYIHDIGLDGRHVRATGIILDLMNAVTISNVTVRNFGTPGYAEGHGRSLDGIYLSSISAVEISHCISTGNERDGIETQAVHVLTIDGCILSGNGRMGAVAEERVDDGADGPLLVRFTDNIVTDNGSGGLDIETAAGLDPVNGYIHGNYVANCGNDAWGYGWGIVLGRNAFGEISGNMVKGFSTTGGAVGFRSALVAGENAGTVNITGNIVAGAGERGVNVNGSGNVVNVTGNEISAAAQDGVNIYNVVSASIVNNVIHDNAGYGVYLSLSPDSRITNNVLVKNAHPIGVVSSPNTVTDPNTTDGV
jgi:parallel beta-helix repeat protein